MRLASRARLLMADSAGNGIYYADREPALLDRDYLSEYERTYNASGPRLDGGIQLFSLFGGGEANPVVGTLGNSYPQANPVLTDDGGYLFYLDDLDNSADATKVRAAVMERTGDNGYDSGNAEIFDADDGGSGYGDSGLSASGNGDAVAAVWSRVMEEPHVTEPGQTVTSDIQAAMMNSSDIFVAVPGASGWIVKNLTENFGGGNLSPVVARRENQILVAWRQVSSNQADVTHFDARDYIYCVISQDGGESWTKPTPIYNGTSGAVKGLETAMLPDGTAAVSFTLQGEAHNISSGRYDQNVAYAIVDSAPTETKQADVTRYVVMEDDTLDENPQLAAVKLDSETDAFILGWYSLDADTQEGDIRLAAIDADGNRLPGFVDALSDLIRNSETAVTADFQFVQNAASLDDLSILWSGTAEEITPEATDDGNTAGSTTQENVDTFGCVNGIRFRTVEENGIPKVSVTAAQRLVSMAPGTAVDSFTAYVDDGAIYLAAQGTYYDYVNLSPVVVEGRSEPVLLPNEKTSIYTAAAQYVDAALRVDSVLPDYPNIRKGAQLPVQITVTNLGTAPMNKLTVEIGGQTKVFQADGDAFVAIVPGETRTVTVQYQIPAEGEIPNPKYTVTGSFEGDGIIARLVSSNTTTESGDLLLNVPDLGISTADILLSAKDGKRTLQLTLYNNSDAALKGSGREVHLAFFSDPECTEQIENRYFSEIVTMSDTVEPLKTISGNDLAKIDDGSYTVQYSFNIKQYIDETGVEDGTTPLKDDSGEIRDAGVTIYAKAWVQLPAAEDHAAGEMQEFNSSNNARSIHMESLLKQSDGQLVTLKHQLSAGASGGTAVTVTIQNNSIVDSKNGNLIVTLYDAQGNKVDAKQTYQSGQTNLIEVGPEGSYQTTIHFDKPGVRAEVTYGELILDEDPENPDVQITTNLNIRDVATLREFNKQPDGSYAANVEVSRLPSTWVDVTTAYPDASVTVNGQAVELGGVPFGLNRGENVLTIIVTWGGRTETYVLTVQNHYPSSGGTTYPIEVENGAKHGSVTVKPSRAERGDTVTITAKPDKGYQVGRVTVLDKNGEPVKVTDKGSGIYTFTMPNGKVSVDVTFVPEGQRTNPFVDVSEGAYYADAVAWAVEQGITAGTSSTTFSPDMSCTRAQIVTFLWRANGSPKADGVNPFTDVSTDDYYYDAVLWAVKQGITSGTSATTFSPDAACTRAQAVTFLYRAAGTPAASGGSFADVAADAYYASAVSWAVSEGITSGTGGNNFSPDAPCTRGQIVTFMYRDAQ